MTALLKRQRHGIASRGAESRRGINATTQFYRSACVSSLPQNWHERLPNPASYFAQHVEKLSNPNATGWTQGRCPIHDDHNASLSVQVSDPRGAWSCFKSCGSGDFVGSRMKRRGLRFREAVRGLIGGAR